MQQMAFLRHTHPSTQTRQWLWVTRYFDVSQYHFYLSLSLRTRSSSEKRRCKQSHPVFWGVHCFALLQISSHCGNRQSIYIISFWRWLVRRRCQLLLKHCSFRCAAEVVAFAWQREPVEHLLPLRFGCRLAGFGLAEDSRAQLGSAQHLWGGHCDKEGILCCDGFSTFSGNPSGMCARMTSGTGDQEEHSLPSQLKYQELELSLNKWGTLEHARRQEF